LDRVDQAFFALLFLLDRIDCGISLILVPKATQTGRFPSQHTDSVRRATASSTFDLFLGYIGKRICHRRVGEATSYRVLRGGTGDEGGRAVDVGQYELESRLSIATP
jgi:hypothetical protein